MYQPTCRRDQQRRGSSLADSDAQLSVLRDVHMSRGIDHSNELTVATGLYLWPSGVSITEGSPGGARMAGLVRLTEVVNRLKSPAILCCQASSAP
jgi:hypothetical protein